MENQAQAHQLVLVSLSLSFSFSFCSCPVQAAQTAEAVHAARRAGARVTRRLAEAEQDAASGSAAASAESATGDRSAEQPLRAQPSPQLAPQPPPARAQPLVFASPAQPARALPRSSQDVLERAAQLTQVSSCPNIILIPCGARCRESQATFCAANFCNGMILCSFVSLCTVH